MNNKKPNIIFYFSDQQRYDTICPEVTPTLHALKATASSFEKAYTCQPVCGPARACLQTGKYASTNGCFRNDIKLDENAVSLAKILNDGGYNTAYIGKWHLASNGISENYQTKATPENRRGGYKYWRAADCLEFTSDGYRGYVYDNDGNKCNFDGIRSDSINDFALQYLDAEYSTDKPFFMFISQLEPHHQNSTDKYECPVGSGEKFKDYPIPADLTAFKGNYKSRYADYLACCHQLDYNVSTLINKLKSIGAWENTILIYTSDHGCHFRTRNMEYKRSCHESSIHVPMIIAGGEFNTGKSYQEFVSLIDMPSTILALAGLTPNEPWDGLDIRPIIQGKSVRDNVYIEMSESQLGRAIRHGDYVYSIKKRRSFGIESAHAKSYVEDKLYDLTKDPHQLNNLIKSSDYNAIKKDLRQRLLEEIKKNTGKTPIILSRITNLNLNP